MLQSDEAVSATSNKDMDQSIDSNNQKICHVKERNLY